MKRLRRPLIAVVILVVILFGAAYVAVGAVIYNAVSRTAALCSARPETEANTPAAFSTDEYAPYYMPDYEEVEFPSREDQITIRGWWIPAADDAANAPAVILVHGLADCKRSTAILFPAGILHQAGFNTLLIDLRDHGDSQVEDGRFAGGTEEYRDVLGAWDWLVQTQNIPAERIGLFGTSLGAATVLIAGGEEPRVAAVWEDSSFADINVAIRAELRRYGIPELFAPAATTLARVISGDDIGSRSPLLAVAKMTGRPLYITHGTADTRLSVQYASDLAAAAETTGVPAEVWIVEGSGHVQAMFDQPDAYAERLVGFFRRTLNG